MPEQVPRAVGVDVGGTKIAAGLVELENGRVLEREEIATRPGREGAEILADCAELAGRFGGAELPVGVGLCELVDLGGRPASGDTIDWRGLDLTAAFGPRFTLDSDVRAAARAEGRFGAGAGRSPFLHVIVGTGTSACLVIDGEPFEGAHGHAIVLGAPPVESVASGGALARRAGVDRAQDVLADPAHAVLVEGAARALGRVLAVLANALDPALIVLGGGLGSQAAFHERVAAAMAPFVAYPSMPPLQVVGTLLGSDSGVIGAALATARDHRR
jgi:glucokinase